MLTNLKNSILAGLGCGIFAGVFASLTQNIKYGIITFIIACLFISICFFIFLTYQRNKILRNIKNEFGVNKIIQTGESNHFVKGESVGGWLTLLTEELVFQSHSVNIHVHKMEIPIKSIIKVAKCNTLGIVPNGIKIITNTGVEQFVVNNRKQWIQNINEHIDTQL